MKLKEKIMNNNDIYNADHKNEKNIPNLPIK